MAKIDSVGRDDVDLGDQPGPDERQLQADLASDSDEPVELTDESASDEPEADGPSEEGELPAEEPTDEESPADETDEEEAPPEPKAKPPAKAAPPEGFASWEEVEDARRWAAYGKARAAQEQAQAQERQQAERRPEPLPEYSHPLAGDETVRRAYEQVTSAADSPAALRTLPPELQQKVLALDTHARTVTNDLALRPQAFFEKYLRPILERSVFASKQAEFDAFMQEARAKDFLRENAAVIPDDPARRRLAELIQEGVPTKHAIRMVELERTGKKAAGEKAKVDDRARTQGNNKAKARANQAAKRGGGRPGVPSADGKHGTDFMAIFNNQKNRQHDA